MLFALNKDKNLVRSSKGIECTCPDCFEPVIPKIGSGIITPHFAHKSNFDCGTRYHDHKGEWHLHWQQTINPCIGGETVEVLVDCRDYRKRADMVLSDNSVVEFQKSPLPLSERLIRESAYNKKMIWIIHSSIQTSQTWKIRDIRTPVLTDRDGFLYYKNWIECFSTEWFIDNVINGDIGIMRLRSILSDIVAKKIVREEKNKMKENKLKEKNEREELERNRIAEWRKKWGIEEEQKFLSDY